MSDAKRLCVSCGAPLQDHPLPPGYGGLITNCKGCAWNKDAAFFRAHLEQQKAHAE